MDTHHMEQADLVRASGLTKQTVSKLLDPSRQTLGRRLADSTTAGLVKAFPEIDEMSILVKVAESMGLPVDQSVVSADRGAQAAAREGRAER